MERFATRAFAIACAGVILFAAPAASALDLSEEERHKLHESITALTITPPPEPWQPHVGGKVPEAVQLYPVPSSLQIMQVVRYRYAVADNKVVLADPLTREIVAVIEK